jgi:hypothetical protein
MSKPGIFTRLATGELQTGKCKRWPSDHSADGGVVFILPTCTGAFSTTSVPLTQKGPVPDDHIEPGKTLTHGEFKERNLKRAQETLARYAARKEV